MKSGARMLGIVIFGLMTLTAISVGGLSAWVYSGQEHEKQASASCFTSFTSLRKVLVQAPRVQPLQGTQSNE
jgi:flagellar basal body-associated protein FliL